MSQAAFLSLASLVAGCIGAASLVRGGVLVPAACHLAAAFLGRRAAILSDSRRLGRHTFQSALSFCMPFLGGCAAFFLSESVKRQKSGTLSDEFAVYLNDAASFRESVPVNDAAAPSADELVPMADILANPLSEAEQRVAVENLASMETPAAMDILRRVIDADTGEGRFFAMTAMGQMEEKLLNRLQDLEEELLSHRGRDPVVLVETARTYMDFSYYQLAQEARRAEFLERAAELLERALTRPNCDVEAWILLGRVKLLEGGVDEALRCFNTCLDLNPEWQAALLWRAEAFYMLGDYARLREDCLGAKACGPVPDNMLATVEYWLGCDAAGNGERRRLGTRIWFARGEPQGVR